MGTAQDAGVADPAASGESRNRDSERKLYEGKAKQD